MGPFVSKLLFDRRDRALLRVVDEIRKREGPPEQIQKSYYPHFHPRGIKEMAESRGIRIAYAVVYLLDSLEVGRVEDRLVALRTLKNEVLTTPEGAMPRNTARVLIEIMKELVRLPEDYAGQLALAHDFRRATSGKPSLIRRMLRRYHLLEMPESWNQIAFDDHVHDANTKGRKSSTHLIMDAWIKGIRRLRVIYYHYIQPRSAMELLEAAAIMGIDVRIGIEFSTRFRNKYANIIWVPRGFAESQAYLCFLAEPGVMDLMAEGRKVSRHQEAHVLQVLNRFNEVHRKDLERRFGLRLDPLDPAEFREYVGSGQTHLVHLGKFIHAHLVPAMGKRAKTLMSAGGDQSLDPEEAGRIIREMDALDPEDLLDRYLAPSANPDLPDPDVPADDPEAPALLRLSPEQVIERLADLHSAFRITLNLSNLDVADVLEILYDCEGDITRLEIFNLKDFAHGRTDHIPEINALQQALNEGNVITLKRIIRSTIGRVEAAGGREAPSRAEKLTAILHDISLFKSFYKGAPIKARIGSDSTGQSPRVHGMGLAVRETLPVKAQQTLTRTSDRSRDLVPMAVPVYLRKTFVPHPRDNRFLRWACRLAESVPGLRGACRKQVDDWWVQEGAIRMDHPGNIITLGGVQKRHSNGIFAGKGKTPQRRARITWGNLNTGLKNGLKVVLGFVPAFATFFLTYDWWVLAWLGAPIWFSITGLRNVVQSVLGGGGFRRSPLLRWNDYVSWDRLTDSLLFTGFSVPLLDLVVKTLVLQHGLGITTQTHPVELYAAMALANGIYISGHNIFRGFPRGAVYANFFRTILSIPLAVLFNAGIGAALGGFGVGNVDDVLQKWAAVISKLASDCVAGIIEGTADRYQNIRKRIRDYNQKLKGLFDTYAELEVLFPDVGVLDVLGDSTAAKRTHRAEAVDLERVIIIDALDMLYFWMYQPRARSALKTLLAGMSDEERQIFFRTQFVLQRHKEITQLFVDGMVGKNFMKALAFYLDRSEEYLRALGRMTPRS